MARVLPLEKIPASLWQQPTVFLADSLVVAYREQLLKLGLLEVATQGSSKKDIHGGATLEATQEHFAHRFGVSASRAEVACLDPHAVLKNVPDSLLTTFAEGHVGLLDIPSGSCTTGASLLSTIAVLRRSGVLPCLPLKVTLCGGDYSTPALEIGEELLAALIPPLSEVGIDVAFQAASWNATSAEETAKLVDGWFAHSSGASEYVVCVSNFSGALIKAGLLAEFEPCLEQILARLYDKKATLLWLEPSTNDAQHKLLPRVWAYVTRRFPKLAAQTDGTQILSSAYQVRHPVKDEAHSSGVMVQRFWRQ